jgi:hypothetical protein
MDNQIFRKESLDQISSPEQLNDYLRVTNPAVWLVLTAVILLLAGMLLWASVASIDSFASGTAQVQDGTMRIVFEDPQIAKSVQTGMTVTAGDASAQVSSIGYSDDGQMFALAPTSLTDGTYSVKVVYRKTQVLSLLFN